MAIVAHKSDCESIFFRLRIGLYERFDMTSDNRYTLSEAALKYSS